MSNPRYDSAGKPLPGIEVRIADDGEVLVRGANVFPGYWQAPEQTAAVLRDGWYHTGDLGRADADGYYYILDRKTDLILVGGLNVYPREVELVLGDHPAVVEAAVIGVPDPVRGEVPKALVVLREGQPADPQALLQWCRQRLANYKVPREITLVPSLPKTVTGKILKTELRSAGEAPKKAGTPAG